MKRRLPFVAVIAVSMLACSKKQATQNPPAPIAPTTTTVASTLPSVSATTVASAALPNGPANPAARPRYMRRVRPDTIVASSFFNDAKTKEKHPAADAFDGERRTSWVEGVASSKGEWLEASFKEPKKIWGVVLDTGVVWSNASSGDLFALNEHGKRIKLRLDDEDAFARDVATDERQIAFDGFDRSLKKIRIVIDDVYPGSKWTDFGISEVSLLVDATAVPSVPTKMIDEEAAAVGGDQDKTLALLKRFGVNPPPSMLETHKVEKVELQEAELAGYGKVDRVLTATFLGPIDESGVHPETIYVVFLGSVGGDRLAAIGSETITRKALSEDLPLHVDVARVHNVLYDDPVLSYVTRDGGKKANAIRIWSAHRAFLERIAEGTSEEDVKLEGEGLPRKLQLGNKALAFDDKSFLFR